MATSSSTSSSTSSGTGRRSSSGTVPYIRLELSETDFGIIKNDILNMVPENENNFFMIPKIGKISDKENFLDTNVIKIEKREKREGNNSYFLILKNGTKKKEYFILGDNCYIINLVDKICDKFSLDAIKITFKLTESKKNLELFPNYFYFNSLFQTFQNLVNNISKEMTTNIINKEKRVKRKQRNSLSKNQKKKKRESDKDSRHELQSEWDRELQTEFTEFIKCSTFLQRLLYIFYIVLRYKYTFLDDSIKLNSSTDIILLNFMDSSI